MHLPRILWPARLWFKQVWNRHGWTSIFTWCEDCGVAEPMVWMAPDDLYAEFTGQPEGGGRYCPNCFDRRAEERGFLLRWRPEIDHWRHDLFGQPVPELSKNANQ